MRGYRNFCRGGGGGNYTFPRIQRGSNFFQGGGGGVRMLISIEPYITFDFPGGPDSLFPHWIRTCHPSTTTSELNAWADGGPTLYTIKQLKTWTDFGPILHASNSSYSQHRPPMRRFRNLWYGSNISWAFSCVDPEGEHGVRPPTPPLPGKIRRKLGFLSNTRPDPLKNYKAT